jgi:hypothetical protein
VGPVQTLVARPAVREIGIALVAYLLYGLVRNNVDGRIDVAEAFAYRILSFEESWGLDVELGFNEWVAASEPVAVTMNYYYALLHFVVPLAVLVWLWRRHGSVYSLARNALLLGSMIALLGFWLLPLAPPRLLPAIGYVDTFWFYDTWGSLSDPALARLSNQYAAMPSLHVGWALWAGVVILVLARRPWVRALGVLYPVVTLVVVVGTANHFVLDAVGSVVVMASGAWLAFLWHRPPRTAASRTRAAGALAAVVALLALLVVQLTPPYETANARGPSGVTVLE